MSGVALGLIILAAVLIVGGLSVALVGITCTLRRRWRW